MALLQGHSDGQSRTYRRIVEALAVPAVFALLTVDGEPAALAYGGLCEGLLCYQSVVADRRRRRQGYARRVVASLAAWGEEHGVEGVCLDVEATNLAALALYRGIGLETELYRYHYRRQPVRSRAPASEAAKNPERREGEQQMKGGSERSTIARCRRARLAYLLIAAGAVLAACAAPPNPDTPAGEAEIARQKCSVCILENPGDGAPCYAICMQTQEGQVAYQRAYVGQ